MAAIPPQCGIAARISGLRKPFVPFAASAHRDISSRAPRASAAHAKSPHPDEPPVAQRHQRHYRGQRVGHIDASYGGTRASKLSCLCDGRIKASRQVVAKSLVGDYRPEHLQPATGLGKLPAVRTRLPLATSTSSKCSRASISRAMRRGSSTKYKAQGNQPTFDASEMHRISEWI